MANTLRCKLAHKKAFFAVLTDPAFASLQDAADQAIVRAHVPWTRLVADVATERGGRRGLLALARRDREHLVLKPNDEYGGTGVMLGWEASESAWDAALEPGARGSARDLGHPGTNPVRREVFPLRSDRPRRDARHAGGPRALPVSRQARAI